MGFGKLARGDLADAPIHHSPEFWSRLRLRGASRAANVRGPRRCEAGRLENGGAKVTNTVRAAALMLLPNIVLRASAHHGTHNTFEDCASIPKICKFCPPGECDFPLKMQSHVFALFSQMVFFAPALSFRNTA